MDCNKHFAEEDKVSFQKQRNLVGQELGFQIALNFQLYLDELMPAMSKEELRVCTENAKKQKNLFPPEKWQVQVFLEQLRRHGVSEGQLARSEYCYIHNNEDTPQRYLLTKGAGSTPDFWPGGDGK